MEHLGELLLEKKYIVWDWNGTLLNDVDLCVSIISELLVENGLSPISSREYRQKFHFPVESYYRELGFDYQKTPFKLLSRQFIAKYNQRIGDCQLFSGVREVLAKLTEKKRIQSILSAAHQDDLSLFLTRHQIDHHFEKVYGLSNHYAASKVSRGRELIASLGAKPQDVILVGDTDHDVEVARNLGIDVIALADGHHDLSKLVATGARVVECRYKFAGTFNLKSFIP